MTPRARWHPWAMLGPTLALLVVFFVLPIGVAACESLFSWDLLTPPRYVGTANYAALAAHGELLHVALRTLAYSALVVSGTMTLGLALALLLDRPGRFFGFVRASVFSAYVVSWVAVALLWMWLLDGNAGLVGKLLRVFGGPPVALLGEELPAAASLAALLRLLSGNGWGAELRSILMAGFSLPRFLALNSCLEFSLAIQVSTAD